MSTTPQTGPQENKGIPQKPLVSSLLDAMKDGREYSSLLEVRTEAINLVTEIRRAVKDIEDIRGRPLLCYVGNVVRAGDQFTSIELADDLPFAELVAAAPAESKQIDMLVVTPGGSGQQVSSFVHKLRPRFENVAFIVPHMCMSAGTIFVASGNEIVMDERGFLGPIDPQVRNREGLMVPAQALFTLVSKIRDDGQKALQSGQNPTWTDIQLLKLVDPKELGNAIAGTNYAVQLVREYLKTYKFSDWSIHSSSGKPVTALDKEARADEIARLLSSHEEWKTHSHGIFRDVLFQKLRIKITHPDATLTRAIRRLWALLYWSFENTNIQKVFLSQQYSLFKAKPGNKTK